MTLSVNALIFFNDNDKCWWPFAVALLALMLSLSNSDAVIIATGNTHKKLNWNQAVAASDGHLPFHIQDHRSNKSLISWLISIH